MTEVKQQEKEILRQSFDLEELGEIGIQVEGLDRKFEDVHAVNHVSFLVPKGALYSLLGPNGAGKTTTINMLSCNLTPSAGDAHILGYSVNHESSQIRKYIGICPQTNVLYEHLSIMENLMFFGKMYEVPKHEIADRATVLIKKLGLIEKKDALVKKLSGGQKRRVNLMAGLIHDPDVLFLDEPTAGLDPQTRRMLWDYLEELKGEKKTIILTTHYMDEADYLSDVVGIMDHGEIIAEGDPEYLKDSIGKGDSVMFKLQGSDSAIIGILDELKQSETILDYQEMTGEENMFRITALDGIGKIGQFVNKFLSNNVKVEDINVEANSLENVFLTLTGRSLRE